MNEITITDKFYYYACEKTKINMKRVMYTDSWQEICLDGSLQGVPSGKTNTTKNSLNA